MEATLKLRADWAKEAHLLSRCRLSIRDNTMLTLFKKPIFQVFLFVISLIIVNWPLISIVDKSSPGTAFLFIYSLWIVVVIILFIIGKSVTHSSKSKDELRERE